MGSKIGELGRARVAKLFIFKIIAGTKNFFISILIKGPKTGKIAFPHAEGKNYFFFLSSVFVFLQTKDQILLQAT